MPTKIKEDLKKRFKMSDKKIADMEKKASLKDVVAELDKAAAKDKVVMDALKECFLG